MSSNNVSGTNGLSSDRANNILPGIEHIDELICANLRIVYDPEDEIDEYNLVPQILEVANTQEKYVADGVKQRKIIVKDANINEVIKILEKDFDTFNYRKNSSGDVEILFDSQEDANRCMRIGVGDLQISRPINYFITTDSEFTVKDLNEKLLLGPLKIEDKKLKAALNEISELSTFRKCYDFVGNTPTNYFVFSFGNKNVAEHLCKFLSFVNVTGRTLIACLFYDKVNVINLNDMFNDRFVVGGHVLTAKIETRIVQVLNMFLPGEISHFDRIDEMKKMIIQEAETEDIINICVPLSLYSKNRLYCPYEGRIYVECKDTVSARSVLCRLGGLIFNGRVVITSFFPELYYKAREFM